MIPPFQGLQMVFSIFILLPIQIFCDNILNLEQLAGALLEEMFGFDFNVPLEIGNVLMWKISGNCKLLTPLQYCGEKVQLGSEETYLLLTQKYLGQLTAYYWLGKYSTLINKQLSAKYAIILTEFLKTVDIYNADNIFVAREVEGIESDSFQHTMKLFNRNADPRRQDDFFLQYVDANFPSPPPNLYVIHGEYPQIKKVPLSLGLHWLLRNDICLILEVGYKFDNMLPINYICGAEASEEHISITDNFITQFYGYFANGIEENIHAIENDRNSNDFKQILKIIGGSRFYKAYEVDDSEDHLKDGVEFEMTRKREVSLFEVTSDSSTLEPKNLVSHASFESNPLHGLLVDTKSISGVLLLFDSAGNVNIRIKAIQLAEDYLDRTYPSPSGQTIKMRIVGSESQSYIA